MSMRIHIAYMNDIAVTAVTVHEGDINYDLLGEDTVNDGDRLLLLADGPNQEAFALVGNLDALGALLKRLMASTAGPRA